ncbi:MAG: 6-carboxytetrahydropterin synthase QueD [Gemmatimonadales bacterium]|nr:6-carboxytetrahydropterin synthase QueD [Gemmatimonadales bacterium]MBT5046303.1 6-carboxytetrahydropterin synthase QueD [Gemmatimonadales bacterium]
MTRFAFTVSAQAHYDAAHFLKNYDGKCRQLHGHRYVVEAAVQSTELDDSGIAFDFVDLKGALRGIADELDHTNLNDLPQFQEVETSAENQAKYFFEELGRRLPADIAEGLLYARVWESPTQWAQYGPADAPLLAPQAPTG